MATFSLVSVNDVDECDRDLVYGYIHEIQKELPSEDCAFYVIPNGIILICLSFYWIKECFIFAHNDYKIDPKGMIINKINRSVNTSAFGKTKIGSVSDLSYIWTFKVIKRNTSMYIGITSKYGVLDQDFWRPKDSSNYSVTSAGSKVSREERDSAWNMRFDTNDTIKMELNLFKKRLVYHKNDPHGKLIHKSRVAFDNIDIGQHISYAMAVSFYNQDCSLELIDFQIKDNV